LALTPRPNIAATFGYGDHTEGSHDSQVIDNDSNTDSSLDSAIYESVTLKTVGGHLKKDPNGPKDEEQTEKWPFESPVIEGWEPDKSTNLSLYLQPDENTTLIMPR
jgi:hypothetical protein